MKLIKNDPGTTLIGSIVAEIFSSEDTSKVLKRSSLARISPIHLIHISFWFSFLSYVQLWDMFLKYKTGKICFSSFCLFLPLCEMGILKCESSKIPQIRFLIYMISASFVPL